MSAINVHFQDPKETVACREAIRRASKGKSASLGMSKKGAGKFGGREDDCGKFKVSSRFINLLLLSLYFGIA